MPVPFGSFRDDVILSAVGGQTYADLLPPATLAGQSPSSGAVGTAGAIAAFTALLASLKTSLDAAFVLFVFLALSGEMAVGSQCSAKRDFALASSHAFCWYSTTAIKAVAKTATATMIQAIRKGVLSRQHLGRRRRFIRKTILFQFNSPVPLKARQAELPVRSGGRTGDASTEAVRG